MCHYRTYVTAFFPLRIRVFSLVFPCLFPVFFPFSLSRGLMRVFFSMVAVVAGYFSRFFYLQPGAEPLSFSLASCKPSPLHCNAIGYCFHRIVAGPGCKLYQKLN